MSRSTTPSLARLRASLSDRDVAIVRTVAELRYITGRQLQVIHFDGQHSAITAARTCRRVLERLAELGVLRRLDRVVGGVRAGSGSYVYGVGPAGHRLLRDGHDRRGFREPSTTFLDHTLAVAGVFAAVVAAAKRDALQIVRYETEPKCWRRLPGYGNETLRPDLLLVVARGDVEWHWWVEVDLGTEHVPAISRKCRQYLRYYQTGSEQSAAGVFPRVAWLTTTQQRATLLQQTARGLAGDLPLFAVGTLDAPLTVLLPTEDRP